MAKQEREKTLNSLEAFIFETQVSTENYSHGDAFECISSLMNLSPVSVHCSGQALPGGIPVCCIRGGERTDLGQTQRSVRMDGWGRLHRDHQAAARETVSAQELVQRHVLQGGGATQAAWSSGCPREHAEHLYLLPEVNLSDEIAKASCDSRWSVTVDCSVFTLSFLISQECQTDSWGWPNLYWCWTESAGEND